MRLRWRGSHSYILPTERYVDMAREIRDELTGRGYDIFFVKNTWNEPGVGYCGVHYQMTAENGIRFEIQLHTPESFQAKMDTHEQY